MAARSAPTRSTSRNVSAPERSDVDRLIAAEHVDASYDVVPRLDVVDRHRIVDADRAHRLDDELVVRVVHTELCDAVAERIDVHVTSDGSGVTLTTDSATR